MNRKTLVVIGAAILILGAGALLLRRGAEKPKLSFTNDDIQTLGNKLNSLNPEDLEGLSGVSSISFTEQELNQLGASIDSLTFEDLAGLSTP